MQYTFEVVMTDQSWRSLRNKRFRSRGLSAGRFLNARKLGRVQKSENASNGPKNLRKRLLRRLDKTGHFFDNLGKFFIVRNHTSLRPACFLP